MTEVQAILLLAYVVGFVASGTILSDVMFLCNKLIYEETDN